MISYLAANGIILYLVLAMAAVGQNPAYQCPSGWAQYHAFGDTYEITCEP